MDAVALAAAKAYANSRLNWRGAWTATTVYAKNDIVTFNGGLYRAPNAFTSGASFVKANWVELIPQSGTSQSFTLAQNILRRLSVVRYDEAFADVMATPPTTAWVAPGGANPVAGAIEVPWKTGMVTVRGTKQLVPETGQPNYGQPADNASSLGRWTPGVVSQVFDWYSGAATPKIAFKVRNTTTNSVYAWLWVDGKPATAAPEQLVAAASGSAAYYSATFAAPGRHRIELFTKYASLGGIEIGATDTVTPVRTRPLLGAVLTDSWGEGTGATTAITGFASTLGRLLGLEMCELGMGGTGWVATSSSPKAAFNDATRIANLIALAPDVVFFSGSSNDDGSSSTTVGANASATLAIVRAALPHAAIFVIGPPPLASLIGNRLTNRDAIKAAAIANGCIFIDPLDPRGLYGISPAWAFNTVYSIGDTVTATGQIFESRTNHTSGSSGGLPSPSTWYPTTPEWGSGKVTATTGSGPNDFLLSSDATHPTDAGHLFRGVWLAEWVARWATSQLRSAIA